MGTRSCVVHKKGQDDVLVYVKHLDGYFLPDAAKEYIMTRGTDREIGVLELVERMGNGILDQKIMTVEEYDDQEQDFTMEYEFMVVVDEMDKAVLVSCLHNVSLTAMVPALQRWAKDSWSITIL